MESVRQMKDGLEAKQERAVELAEHALEVADQSLAAIGQITFWSSLILVGFTFLTAFAAIFGYRFIHSATIKKAEEVANERLQSYLREENFIKQISDEVHKEVEKQLEERQLEGKLEK